jgi:hypothetical protein
MPAVDHGGVEQKEKQMHIRIRNQRAWNALLSACVLCLWLSLPLSAQYAHVSGTVRDTSGAVIPGAALKLNNQATGVSHSAQTNTSGLYSFPDVQAGTYNISTSAQGFQSERRVGLTLNVADHLQVDFELKIGQVAESVTVTDRPELLNAANSVTGQTVDRKFINDLPLITRSAFDLAFLAPGVTQAPALAYGQTASGGGYGLMSNDFVSNGSRNATSDILIDGITTNEMVSGGLYTFATYTPSVDAVQEFKVQQSNFSAEYGFSGATIVNVVTRSGANDFHGSGFEFLRNNKLDANNFFNNANGINLPALRQNIFGATVGGPIKRNRAFFFFDYEGTRIRSLETARAGVPSAAEKKGDFGELCPESGGAFSSSGMCSNPNGQLWDPYSGVYSASAGGAVRSAYIPFNNMATYMSPGSPRLNGTGYQLPAVPGNLIDPVAQKMMQYYPDPNVGVGTPGYDRFNNWIGSGSALTNNDQWDAKIDQRFSDSDSLSARYSVRKTLQRSMNCFGNLADPCSSGPQDSTAHLFSLNFTHIFSPSTVLSLSYGLTRSARFYQSNTADYPQTDPVKLLGMPSYIETSGVLQLPSVLINEYGTLNGNTSIGNVAWGYLKDGQTTHDLLAALSKVTGKHELKFGGEFRMRRFGNGQPGTPAGEFVYDYNGTSQMPWTGGGDAMATFLTGTSLDSWGQYEVPAFLMTQNFEWAGYVQDNYRVSDKLTVNVGLRYELVLPATERYNRLNWVDPNAASPVQAPGFPNLKGAEIIADSNHRSAYGTDFRDFEPRIGLAYRLDSKTVLRTGYGIYYDMSAANASADAVNAQGFVQKTPWTTTYQGDGATPWGRLSDPFPGGVELPPGRSLGLWTNVGLNPAGPDPAMNVTPYEQSWSFGLQRSMPWGVMVDADYIGKKGTHLYFGGAQNLNHLGPEVEHYSQAQITALNTLVPNPFYGIITDPTSPLSNPTVAEAQLQMPYPQFKSFTVTSPPWANSSYNAFQLTVEKQFAKGLQFLVTYANSKSLDDESIPSNGGSFLGGSSSAILDPNNLALQRSLSAFDIPQVLQFSYVYQLPFGHNRPFLRNLHGVLNGILGGWQTNGMWRFDNGMPLQLALSGGQPLPGGYGQRPDLNGVPERNHGSDWLNQYFANPEIFSVPAPYTLGTAPRNLSLRAPGTSNATLSLFKDFSLSSKREGMRLQYRLESFNALNHPQFAAPNTTVGTASFGKITSQANLPREVQMALKLYW